MTPELAVSRLPCQESPEILWTVDLIADTLLQLEEQTGIFEVSVEGVPVWERLRHHVLRRLLMHSGLHGEAHTRIQRNSRYAALRLLQALRNLLLRNPFRLGQREILFYGTPRRKLESDGRWWDLFCDPLAANLQRSYAFLEEPYQGRHCQPARSQHLAYLDSLIVGAALRRDVLRPSFPLSARHEQNVVAMEQSIAKALGAQLSLREMIRTSLAERGTRLPAFMKLLKRTRPQLAILAISYGKETFIEACKMLEIPVIELQHGIISNLHFGYSYPGPIRSKRCFPDYFFAFGDFWKHALEFPIPDCRVLSIGYPYLERAAVHREPRDPAKERSILFISQGTIGEPLSKLAVALSEATDSTREIVYKLHPGEFGRWRDSYPWLSESSVRVIEDESSLYELFHEAGTQIGVYSTALFEGLAFSLSTILIDLPGVENLRRLFADGRIPVVDPTPEVVLNVIQKAPRIPQREDVFRSRSLARMKTAIEILLDEGTLSSSRLEECEIEGDEGK